MKRIFEIISSNQGLGTEEKMKNEKKIHYLHKCMAKRIMINNL